MVAKSYTGAFNESNLAVLLQNRTFVDYFNVYLSLPAFSQRLIYKFEDKDFEFDPPIKRTTYVLDKKKLVEWLVQERIPGFLKTDLYFEYLLCEELLTTKLRFTESSHRLDYEEHRVAEDASMLAECLGHVAGMRHFRHYIAGTSGEKVLRFWLDAERFHNIPENETGARWRMFREIQMKYFKGNLFQTPEIDAGGFNILKDGRNLLQNSDWSLNLLGEKITEGDVETCSSDTPRSDRQLVKVMSVTDFTQIQYLILTVLKDYWVQKYVLHCEYMKSKIMKKRPGDPAYKINSKSDLLILKDIKEIDKALSLLQGSLKPNTAKTKRTKYSWRSMFPDHLVDQSFLEQGGDIVTLHDDGFISVDPIDASILDKVLERYILSDDSSENVNKVTSKTQDQQSGLENDTATKQESSGKTSQCQEQGQPKAEGLNSDKSVGVVRNRNKSGLSIADLSRRSSVETQRSFRISSSRRSSRLLTMRASVNSCESNQTLREEANIFPERRPSAQEPRSQSRLRQRRSSESFIKRVQGAIKRENDKKEPQNAIEIPPNSRPTSSLDIMRQIAGNERNRQPKKLMKASVELFEQLLQLNFDPWQEEQSERERPLSCPLKAVQTNGKTKALKLPKLSMKKDGKKDALDKGITEAVKLPSINGEFPLTGQKNTTIPEDREMEISTPTYVYRNFCEGYFRYDNKMLVLSTAADVYAGNPFRNFLKDRGYAKCLYALTFWHDVQTFLNTKSEKEEIKQQLRCRRSKILILRYLSLESKSLLPPGLVSLLRAMLFRNKGDDLLREAQDFSCKILHNVWRIYMNHDKRKFRAKCLKTRRKISENFKRKTMSDSRFALEGKIPEKPEEDDGVDKHQNEKNAESSYCEDENVLPTDSERRLSLALQLTLDVSEELEEGLPIEPLNIDELKWDPDDQFGSLAIKPLVLIQRKDITEELARQKFIAEQRRARLKLERLRLSELEKAPIISQGGESVPLYMKPIKRNGTWHQRTQRPRNFNDMLKDDIQREFFRRFLIHHGAEVPLIFYQAVNDIKAAKEPRTKQTKIANMVKKYFPNASHAVETLKTSAGIITEIPMQEKVTQSMLVSAQNWVGRALQENWYDAYLKTFPEAYKDVLLGEAEDILRPGMRLWGKSRTKSLWRAFVKSLVAFRKAILDPRNSKMFQEWLKIEARKEVERQKISNQSYVPGMPVKKLIKNRLVDVNKLANDMHFLAETDRFRTMCDNAAESIKDGKYYAEDERMIDSKAKTIVECYIDSEIPPRTQINVSQELVEETLAAYNNGMTERGLFYRITLAIFPIMAYLWKKFQSFRIEAICKQLEERKTGLSAHGSIASLPTPDFFNMNFSEVTTKKVIRGHEDDTVHILFSMANGMKLILPIYHHGQELHFHKGDDNELQPMMSNTSKLTMPRASVLLHRRNATGMGMIRSSTEAVIERLTVTADSKSPAKSPVNTTSSRTTHVLSKTAMAPRRTSNTITKQQPSATHTKTN